MESVRIGKCRNWKVSELESVRIGKCQNWKVSELKYGITAQNWNSSESLKVSESVRNQGWHGKMFSIEGNNCILGMLDDQSKQCNIKFIISYNLAQLPTILAGIGSWVIPNLRLQHTDL